MAYGQIRTSSGRELNLTPQGWINNEGVNLNDAPLANNALMSAAYGQQARPEQVPMGGQQNALMRQLQPDVVLDVSRPVEVAGKGKGFFAKNDPYSIYDAQGNKIADVGNDQAATRARQKEDLAIESARANLDQTRAQTAAMQSAKLPPGYRMTPEGNLQAIPGGPADLKQSSGKPLPATAVKLQNDALQALGSFKSVDADLGALEKQITEGKLEVGPVNRALGYARTNLNQSTENDRNIAALKTKLEGMRNAILLMGKGVQTEGDAQRALDEILSNLNDQELLKQRLPELRAKLQRDATLQKSQVELLRSNYGVDPMDFSKFENQPPSVNLNKTGGGYSDTAKEQRYQQWLKSQG